MTWEQHVKSKGSKPKQDAASLYWQGPVTVDSFSISVSGPNAKNLVLHGMFWRNQQLFWNREGIAKSRFASPALRSAEVKLSTENYFVTAKLVGVGLVKRLSSEL